MNKPLHVHFLGICGTAMGSVASAMAARKDEFSVSGSDTNMYPPMSDVLKAADITLFEGYDEKNIPENADVIVIGNAMSRLKNSEVEAVLNRRLHYRSLPETMKEYFLRGKHNFVVSGTHGKTTTTSMLTWIMECAGKNPSFMIGGVPGNFDFGGRFTDSDYCVLEGDEYDTAFFDKRSKFLHYLPEVAIVNNIEFDHADIYNNIDEIKLSFRRLLQIVPGEGLALINADDDNCTDIARGAPCPVRKVGLGDSADARISDVRPHPEGCLFCLNGTEFFVPMVGLFNVRNAAMSIEAARFAGIDDATIAQALKSFRGVARRQEVRGVAAGITVIDDFAHHPTAIRESIRGMRQRYPDARLWAVFEPRSNTTRRNIFQHELAQSLASADFPIVAAVDNPGKVSAEDRLDSDQLRNELITLGKDVLIGEKADKIVEHIAAHAQPGDVVLVMSNGGFDGIHDKLLTAFSR